MSKGKKCKNSKLNLGMIPHVQDKNALSVVRSAFSVTCSPLLLCKFSQVFQ